MTNEQVTEESAGRFDEADIGVPSSISTNNASMRSQPSPDAVARTMACGDSGSGGPDGRDDLSTPKGSENDLGLPSDLTARWQSVQVAFVDEPRRAVQDADALIAEVTDRLLEHFRQQRAELEHTWSSGEDASTEDLRLALQKYRSFFERLLAA